MPKPSQEDLPFVWSEGWPEPPPGSVVTFREAGITLGSLLLEDWEWQTLLSRRVLSLRVDEHPATDGWATRQPDGIESVVEFTVPLAAVVVPPDALVHSRAFSEWVTEVHGALGRLLVWDETEHWWMVNEPDLELLITCAPLGLFVAESEELSWLPIGIDEGRRKVDELRTRYGL